MKVKCESGSVKVSGMAILMILMATVVGVGDGVKRCCNEMLATGYIY